MKSIAACTLLMLFGTAWMGCGLAKKSLAVASSEKIAVTTDFEAYQRVLYPYIQAKCAACHTFGSTSASLSFESFRPRLAPELRDALRFRLSNEHCVGCKSPSEVDTLLGEWEGLLSDPRDPEGPNPEPEPEPGSGSGPRLAVEGSIELNPLFLPGEQRTIEVALSGITLSMDLAWSTNQEMEIRRLALRSGSGAGSAQGIWFRFDDAEWSTPDELIYSEWPIGPGSSPSESVLPLRWRMHPTRVIPWIRSIRVGISHVEIP